MYKRVGPACLLIPYRRLLLNLSRNDLASRFAGSILGLGWIVLSPLVLLAIYAVVYLVIFRVRAVGLTPVDYVLYIFSGLVPFLVTAQALCLGVQSVVSNKAVLSNTVFPIDLAPAKAVLISQGSMIVGLPLIIVATVFTLRISWAVLLVPVVWGLHMLALIGIAWILSLLNVVFRDLENLVAAVIPMLMVLSPIAYTPEMVPSQLKLLLMLNPMAYYVTTYQSLLLYGELPSPVMCGMLVVLSLGFFFSGSWFFGRAKEAVIDYV